MDDKPLVTDSEIAGEDVESSNVMTTPRPHGSKTALRFGVACVVLAAVGLVGFYVKTSAPNGTIALMQRLSKAHGAYLKAFHERALEVAAGDFTGSVEIVFKEDGSTDPKERSKMKVTATIQAAKGPKINSTAEKVTLIAKNGKEGELKDTVEKFMEGVSQTCNDQKDCVEWCKSIKVTTGKKSEQFGSGNFVFVEIPFPPSVEQDQGQEDLQKAFKEQTPVVVGEIDFGRTIDEMWEKKETNLAELPDGIQTKDSVTFASTLWQAAEEMSDTDMPQLQTPPGAPRPQSILEEMPGLKELKSRNDFAYLPGGAGLFRSLPTMKNGVQMLKMQVNGMPPFLSTPLKDLPKSCDGMAGAETVGLPSGLEAVLKFENFHPSILFPHIFED